MIKTESEKACHFCLFYDMCKGKSLENFCEDFQDKWEYDKLMKKKN